MATTIKKATGLNDLVDTYAPGSMEQASDSISNNSTVDRLRQKCLLFQDYQQFQNEAHIRHLFNAWQYMHRSPRTLNLSQEPFPSVDTYLQETAHSLLTKHHLQDTYTAASLVKAASEDLDEFRRKAMDKKELDSSLADLLLDQESYTPKDIDALLQTTIGDETNEDDQYWVPLFFNILIQKKYNQEGCNHFVLHTKALAKQSRLLNGLEGSEQDPLTITIEGPLGLYCASKVQYCAILVHGEAGYNFGSNSYRSSFGVQDLFDRKKSFRQVSECSIQVPWKTRNDEWLRHIDKHNSVYFVKAGRRIHFNAWRRFCQRVRREFSGQ